MTQIELQALRARLADSCTQDDAKRLQRSVEEAEAQSAQFQHSLMQLEAEKGDVAKLQSDFDDERKQLLHQVALMREDRSRADLRSRALEERLAGQFPGDAGIRDGLRKNEQVEQLQEAIDSLRQKEMYARELLRRSQVRRCCSRLEAIRALASLNARGIKRTCAVRQAAYTQSFAGTRVQPG